MEDIGSLYKMFDDLMEIQKQKLLIMLVQFERWFAYFDHNSKKKVP